MKLSFFNFSCPKCDDDDHHRPAVCGSDHKTYKSICHLRAAACTAKTAIIVLKNGACEEETSPLHPGKSHGKPNEKLEGGEGIDSFFSDQQQQDGEDARWGGGAGTDKDFRRGTDESKLLKDQGDEGEEDARWGGGAGVDQDFPRSTDESRLLKDQEEDGEEDARWGGGAGVDKDFPRSTDESRLLKDQEEDGEEDARWGGGAGVNKDFPRSTDESRLLKDQEEDEEYDNLRRDDDN